MKTQTKGTLFPGVKVREQPGRGRKFMRRILVGAAISMLALGLSAPVASAGDGRVEKNGSCSGSTDWKLKVKPDNGRLEVEFEVDQNVNGQEWRVVLKDNGDRFFRGTKTTHGPSGSFEVNKRANDQAGTDQIKARARNLSSDELCKGRASI